MAPHGKYTLANQDTLRTGIGGSMTNILKNWDDNDSYNAYLRYYILSAILNFGGPKVGRDAIRAARDSMIHPVNGPII